MRRTHLDEVILELKEKGKVEELRRVWWFDKNVEIKEKCDKDKKRKQEAKAK